MFADFFIRRPVFATVCALLIILAGAAVVPTLPIAQFPDLAPPQVGVTSAYIGASAQTVESAVTIPLEQQINGAEGMKYMTSTSGNDGTSQILVTFDLTRNPDLATVDIQNRVNTAQGRLPAAVKAVGITTQKTSQNFVFGAAVTGYSTLFMSNYLDVYVRDALKRIPGVADVQIFGQGKYAMRLWLDPVRMAGRGLTAPDVVNALSEQNVEVAAGQVGQQPAMPGQNYQISVRAVGRLSEPAQFDDIILKTNADGTLVRLRDVGHAELGSETYAADLQYNGQDATGFGVLQLSSANALQVHQQALAELQRLSKSFPPGMHYQVAFDTTDAVSESIRDVLFTVGSAIFLVILVIFIFLGDWRTTMIHFIATPVSLIGTFAFVKLLGFSINTLTLFGITLATGLVVDDAIVVIENIERHIAGGEHDSRKAATDATTEITSAVIATSLVLVAVFVPVAFFPGTTGILFRQFALTIAFSIAISAFNALTLAPALAAIFLAGGHHGQKWWWLRKFEDGVSAVTRGYRRLLHHLLGYRLAMAILFFAGLGLTYFVFMRVPTGFVPDEDQGYFMIIIQAPSGASLEYTKAVGAQVSKILAGEPEIEGVFSVAGFSFAGAAANQGIIFVPLKPYSQRKGEMHSAAAIVNRVRPKLFGVSGAIVFATLPPAVQGLGQFGGFQFEVQDQAAHTLDELAAATQGILRDSRGRKELAQLFTSFTANDPQYLVTIDREKAKSLHVPLSQITDTLGVYMGSSYVNDFDFNNRSYRVYVQADKQFRAKAENMKQFYVRSDSGAMVPLDNLINITQTTTPQVISHYNLFRSAEIDGSPAPGYSSGQAIAAMEQLASKMPKGFAYSWTGLSLEELQAGGTSLLLFGLGTLVVYLTLSAQYESFVLPFIVLLAVPMALLGALGAQWIRGLQNDVFCQVGLVMLVGLSSKNAILIVEFSEQLRERGLPLIESAVQAATIRLRPILMTSLAFILGVVPLVVATGAGENGRHSVGTTVFGGMIMSTVLNLFFIPVLYLIVEGWRERGRAPKQR
ncbi:MAG TPA: multidrug efflux RND transporter permease subunit [Candidatus Sulfotelmatobacter sp.]|nr:multidrug efflux RND transporter permease subunit [Candidatus Sulfotelmatobacter sp.]